MNIKEEREILDKIEKKTILMRACLICRRCGCCDEPDEEDDCSGCVIYESIVKVNKEEK